jgi:serine phosphatase RsbU (regulator of sigma subunit)
MQIVVGWDNPIEAETIELCLNIDGNSAVVTVDPEEFERAATAPGVDVALLSINFPDFDTGYQVFERLRAKRPDLPIVGAWSQGEINQVAKFIAKGLHSYLARDEQGEFIFLLMSILEAAQQSVVARQAHVLAEKLREEVESVRELQESVIPRDLPAPRGYRLAGRYEPSQIRVVGDRPVVMAGGDYYDAFALSDDAVILVLGDAAGHGVKACLSIMTMHTLIGMIRDNRYPNTGEFVTEVNRRLCRSDIVAGQQGGFITLLYCMLDASTHRFQWTSAGHPMPLLQNLDTGEITALATDEQGGLPLAIDEDWVYESCEATIPPRSRVLLYTDGLDEAFPDTPGDEHHQFGQSGIIQTLRNAASLSLEQALEKLFADSLDATGGAGRHDDTSVVLVERME